MNKIDNLFLQKRNNIISVFFTAGFPELNSTTSIIQTLENNGVDLIEIGIPYSDPLADGPIIQNTSTIAINNGFTIEDLFNQLQNSKQNINVPLILMGYLNPIMQYGVEHFLSKASDCGISGVIIPDLPIDEYRDLYKKYFEQYRINFIFLITPNTSKERIEMIDNLSKGFIYAVSSSSTTGKESSFSQSQVDYLKRINAMKLENPILVGFGIHSRQTLQTAWNYANGAIIGSAYLKILLKNHDIEHSTKEFFKTIN